MQISIFQDESIHSYLIRVLSCQGKLLRPSDLYGLVSLSGVVNAAPKLDSEHGKLLSSYSSTFIEKLLCEHTPLNSMHSSELIEAKDYVLFGKRPLREELIPNGRTQLRYCRKCFAEQTFEHGVSWFRLDWLFSIRCVLHQEVLSHVFSHSTSCCSASMNILDSVLSATSGRCRKCGGDFWKHEKSLYINPDYRQNYLLIKQIYRPALL
ncbi:TniQ family protein [Shewanella intestini]|uniref:TniQ family protein n=1 Tax=Shewanella intestini TaxID=2017544 RepID=A0ABS5I5E2_9GAMM|nr:hypothetical protein [Shewanella intestini]MRG37353.1 hypothetical protein [Shewanella sp. XMDDZSB0408]